MYKYISNSREHQDLVILSILNKKRQGTYVEVGANHYMQDSNTYLLEKSFDWRGVSFEMNKHLCDEFNKNRTNPCVSGDATRVDYEKIFQQYSLPVHIDFLQLDIDPHQQTLKALKRIPFNQRTFSFITYEHDAYRGGKQERIDSRNILQELGYTLLLQDVMHAGVSFEDWYINKEYMPNDAYKAFQGNNINMNPGNLTQQHIDLFKSL